MLSLSYQFLQIFNLQFREAADAAVFPFDASSPTLSIYEIVISFASCGFVLSTNVEQP